MTIIHNLTAVLSGIWGEAEEAPNCLTTYKITNIIINLAEKYLGRENVWLMRTLCTWMRQRLMMERLRPCATARSIICCHCMLIGYPPASSVVIVVVVLFFNPACFIFLQADHLYSPVFCFCFWFCLHRIMFLPDVGSLGGRRKDWQTFLSTDTYLKRHSLLVARTMS